MDRRHFLGGMRTVGRRPRAVVLLERQHRGRAAGPAPAPAAPRRGRCGTATARRPSAAPAAGGDARSQTNHTTIALGVVPVAVSGSLGSSHTPFRPWNDGSLTTTPPVLDIQEIAFEKVAALAPDLILAVMSGVTKGDTPSWSRSRRRSPSRSTPTGPCRTARPPTHREALGKPDVAATMVTELDAAFADARAKNPQLGGDAGAASRSSAGSTPSWGPPRRVASSSSTSG